MEMGAGSSSRARPKRKKGIKKTEVISYEQSVVQLSKEGRKTYMTVEKKRKRPMNTIHGAYSAVFDNTYPQYNWLYNGWLVEERRIMLSGRLYRYYYDPKGKEYKFRYQVEQVLTSIGKHLAIKKPVVIVLDD
ncbi:hypothetical protein Bca4012_046280 [Brassica carinata]|uniref:Uncharacterized protein n=2 Tax=Brassica TaxID=3705 RepID=A0A8X7UBW9_BRACI|nr:hypothetical protein Bca52824_056545 [Brassica carinata]VDD33840.1 unnamed protein product [Brassica oleracea]